TTQEFKDTHVTLTLVNPDGQQQSSSVSSQFVTSMLNPTPDAGIDSLFETSSQMDVQAPTTVASLTLSAPTVTPATIATISTVPQAPTPPTTAQSTLLQDLLNFGSLFRFDHRLKTLEANFSKLCDEAQAKNEEFLKNLDENIQKIIKEQVKEHVKVQVSKILPKIKKTVNKQLEAEVLTWSSNSSKTSYAIAADLSEIELKKILIEKMEGNKDVVMMMRTKIKNPPLDQAGGLRGEEKEKSKSQQLLQRGKRPGKLASLHKGLNLNKRLQASAADDQPITEASQHPEWFPQQKKPLTPNRDWNKTLPATHESIQPWISELAKQADSRSSFNELMDTHVDFSAFLMNRLKLDTLTPELLAGPTYEQMKGPCKSLVELEFILEEVYKKADKSDGRRTICFQRLSKNVHKKHRNPKACGRPSTSNGALNDVRTTLDDRLKGIRMTNLPQTIWRKSDKERAAAMIQAIDKQLKTRRIMRSLEKFVGKRLYEGDFRMLQRAI
nr:hypothetical protein [Tanacetum cinerariifolium]